MEEIDIEFEKDSNSDSILVTLYGASVTEKQKVAFQRLIECRASGDDLSVIVNYDPLQVDTILPAAFRAIVEHAFTRIRITKILQHAIRDDDDLTICRWYEVELTQNNLLLSDEDIDRVNLAVKRQNLLLALRQHSSDAVADELQDLVSSNLLTARDELTLSVALGVQESGSGKSTIYTDIMDRNPDSPESTSIERWLIGKLQSEQETVRDFSEPLSLEVSNYGYAIRVEEALASANRLRLMFLINHRSSAKYHLPNLLLHRVNSFLNRSQDQLEGQTERQC